MDLQSLKLLHPMVLEEIHLQENELFDLECRILYLFLGEWDTE